MFSQKKWSQVKSSCELLLDCVTAIGGSDQGSLTEDQDTIRRILRKLTIATVLEGRAVVGVAGLQGSGKTTLVRGLYNLPESVLVPTSGRGERIPVLVVEDDVEEPEAFRTGLEKQGDNWAIRTESITMEQLDRDAADGGNTSTMMLELHVPRPDRRGGGQFPSLLLLPGFEERNDEQKVLTEFSIRCSGTCVYVSSRQQNAMARNKKCLEELQEIFHDRKPIYALSFSNLAEDYNEGFRTTFLKEHPEEDEERVICVGRTRMEQWIPRLEEQILKCAYTAPERTQAQEKLLLELLVKDFEKLASIADRYKKTIKLADTLGDDKYLVNLDKRFRELRPQIAQALGETMKGYEANSLSYLKNHWEQPSGLAALKHALLGMGTKEIFQIEQRVEDAIQCKQAGRPSGRQTDPAPQDCIAAYLEGTQKSLKRIGTQRLTPELKQDIALLLRPELAPAKQFQSKDIMPVLSAIPRIAAHTFLSVVDRGFQGEFTRERPKGQEETGSLSNLAQGGLDGQKALLLLLGIDFVPDGKLDFIPAVAKALEIPLPAAVAGLAAAATMGMILKGWRDSNRRDVSELYEARKAIHNFYQDQEKKYLDAYDQYCGEIRRQVEENLIVLYGLNRGGTALLNIYAAIGDLRDAYYEIYKEIRAQSLQPGMAMAR